MNALEGKLVGILDGGHEGSKLGVHVGDLVNTLEGKTVGIMDGAVEGELDTVVL